MAPWTIARAWSRQTLLSLLAVAAFSTRAEPPVATETALLAGGCFWTLQAAFDRLPGVLATSVGFAGGRTENPTYVQVVAGGTGHLETVRVEFDPRVLSFSRLLEAYWRNIDPTRSDEQFCDIGRQYNPTIFYENEAQHEAAVRSRSELERSKPFRGTVRTPIAPAPRFWPAEAEQQQYYLKQPELYARYVRGCGRADRLAQLWRR
jgi:peptide-methionine (S)-S-oxide reductase